MCVCFCLSVLMLALFLLCLYFDIVFVLFVVLLSEYENTLCPCNFSVFVMLVLK